MKIHFASSDTHYWEACWREVAPVKGYRGAQQACMSGPCHRRVWWVPSFFRGYFFHRSSSVMCVHEHAHITHLLQNVNLGHNKWNICKAPGVISANCILILAIMGRRCAPSRRADGDKWWCEWKWMDRNGSRPAASHWAKWAVDGENMRWLNLWTCSSCCGGCSLCFEPNKRGVKPKLWTFLELLQDWHGSPVLSFHGSLESRDFFFVLLLMLHFSYIISLACLSVIFAPFTAAVTDT